MQTDESIRLNKHLALQLGVSRRQADDLIARGSVRINDTTAILGSRFKPGDIISVNGEKVADNTAYEYLAFNKPAGYVCSRKQQGDNPTIYDIIPIKYHHLKPVGRLDRDSSGLILLSNDGNFAFNMTHPSFAKTKIYNVRLEHDLSPLHQQMINDHGINLDDGRSQLKIERMNEADRKSWIVTMTERRNRQIRRTFGALGYTVKKLRRTNFGNYALGDIKTGEFEIVNIH